MVTSELERQSICTVGQRESLQTELTLGKGRQGKELGKVGVQTDRSLGCYLVPGIVPRRGGLLGRWSMFQIVMSVSKRGLMHSLALGAR